MREQLGMPDEAYAKSAAAQANLNSLRRKVEIEEAFQQRLAGSAQLAREIAESGKWRLQGAVTSYVLGLTDSRKEHPIEFRGTKDIPLEDGRAIALRERDSEGPEAVPTLTMVINKDGEYTELAIFDGGVNIVGLEQVGPQQLDEIENLLHYIQSSPDK